MPIFHYKGFRFAIMAMAFPAYFCLASDLRLYNRIFRQFRTFLQFCSKRASILFITLPRHRTFRGRGPAYVIVHLIDGSEALDQKFLRVFGSK
jgi:hypothetical protein